MGNLKLLTKGVPRQNDQASVLRDVAEPHQEIVKRGRRTLWRAAICVIPGMTQISLQLRPSEVESALQAVFFVKGLQGLGNSKLH